jgi:hypothetical protein
MPIEINGGRSKSRGFPYSDEAGYRATPRPEIAWNAAQTSGSLFVGLMFLWDLLDTFNEAAGIPVAFFVGGGWKRSRVTNH